MEYNDSRKLIKEVTIYFITTIILTWMVWLPAFLIQNQGIELALTYDFFITIGTLVPSCIGLLLTYYFGGKSELILLLKSLLNVRIIKKELLYILLVMPIVLVVSCLVLYLSGEELPSMQFPFWFIPIAFVYILLFMGPLGEELGWRGFALKKMLGFKSPFIASLLLGILWSTWHLPLFFIHGTTQNTLISFGIIPALLGYFLYTLMISFLITLLFLLSNGNVFSSILLHTIGNLSLGFVPIIFIKKGAIILLLTLVITVTAFVYKYKKLMFKKINTEDIKQ